MWMTAGALRELEAERDELENAGGELSQLDQARLIQLRELIAERVIGPRHIWGTINCDGINANGEICGVTTTSGLAWKIPGRVGDSPILGAGLYVDGTVGAAGSTGRGGR